MDTEYCSAAHRQQARDSLDRTLSDIDDAVEERWPVSRRQNRSGSSAQAASALFLVTVLLLVLAVLTFSGNGSSAGNFTAANRRNATNGGGWLSGIGESLSRTLRSRAPVTLSTDFRLDTGDWLSAARNTVSPTAGEGEWTFGAQGLKPGRLRIWKRTAELTNYEMDVVAQIDKKSLNWAFRALNTQNYYATKLIILKPGTSPNTGLVRSVVLDGQEYDRAQFPLPLTINPGEQCRVRMTIKQDHFITTVNGQVVSSWHDQRLPRGGVGFFAEAGESSTIRYLALSERDSLVGRVLAYFSLIRMPGIGDEDF